MKDRRRLACPLARGPHRPSGYYNFIEAMQDPEHPEHDDLKEWHGAGFDPGELNLDDINEELRRHRPG